MQVKHILVAAWFVLLALASAFFVIACGNYGTHPVSGAAVGFYFLYLIGGGALLFLIDEDKL